MNKIVLAFSLLVANIGYSQNSIEWDGTYKLELSDFKSPATQIGDVAMYSLHMPSGIDFSFAMSNVEFMFTKNFNSKVNTVFSQESSSIVAPDIETAESLVNFANYQFDLAELYARKLRKKISEEKGTFSNASFLKPLYDSIQNEFSNRFTLMAKESDLGRNRDLLEKEHALVLEEIQELSQFCKTCKLAKK
ncbi:hypothetical protein [Myroides guanonis]|uniref:Uncharacterized protein n=1 Tax=Myroides guanonis TaxID=1150112 RepID=A0A1I3V0N6_9FLAO|nr:hypothetical protein [Myroides guanonis]SFJ88710.1 hypothetical protein SAMN04487893_1221 [Myroides guanonis]